MSISGISAATTPYSTEQAAATPAKGSDDAASVAALADDTSQPAASTGASSIVTLGDGTTSSVTVYSGQLSSMPMSVATAPELFAEADQNQDKKIDLQEFTAQMQRIGMSADDAGKLFQSIIGAKNGEMSIDEYVSGVISTNAGGSQVFQKLYSSYTTGPDGKADMTAWDAFKKQGESAAADYWTRHPELQQRH